MSGELSQFEQKSAIVPKQTPYGILGGFVLAIIIFILVSNFAANEAVDDLKKEKDKSAETESKSPETSGDKGEVDI